VAFHVPQGLEWNLSQFSDRMTPVGMLAKLSIYYLSHWQGFAKARN
jgi:hypothetical protein